MAESLWTRRTFLETSLKTGAGVTVSAAAFGPKGATGETIMPATEGVSEPSITLAINGAPHTLTVDVRTSLLDLLRERLP